MDNTLLIIVLLAIAAETTYLVGKSIKSTGFKKYDRPIFVDTSVLIDGRIISVAQSGFITGTLYIPRSVIGELQFLADQGDHEKRSRARYGLDVVSELQALTQVSVKIFADGNKAEEGVDNRLLKLAKQYKGSICTIDYNLNKVAQTESIPVLNVNDLAMNLRMAYLPGERVMIELTQKGNDSHQAVGHLKDGTMVVVEQASSLLGKSAEIEFIRSLQTAAGKMMFAKLVEKPKPKEKPTVKQTVITTTQQPYQKPNKQQRYDKPEKPAEASEQPQTPHSAPKPSYNTARPSQPRPSQNQNQNRTQNKKPRTSAQKEDDLIKLLNNQ
jgi:rRNA-processing protein FCF1